MANFNDLIATINANITTNDNQEITGAKLNLVLRTMVEAINTLKVDCVPNPTSAEDNIPLIDENGGIKDSGKTLDEITIPILTIDNSWFGTLSDAQKVAIDTAMLIKLGDAFYFPNAPTQSLVEYALGLTGVGYVHRVFVYYASYNANGRLDGVDAIAEVQGNTGYELYMLSL